MACVVLVLIVGFKSIEPSSATVGTYQAFMDGESRFMINTMTGEIYKFQNFGGYQRIWTRYSPVTDWIDNSDPSIKREKKI